MNNILDIAMYFENRQLIIKAYYNDAYSRIITDSLYENYTEHHDIAAVITTAHDLLEDTSITIQSNQTVAELQAILDAIELLEYHGIK